MESKLLDTSFDVCIEKIRLKQLRKRQYDLIIHDNSDFFFDMFPDQMIQIFRKKYVNLPYHQQDCGT